MNPPENTAQRLIASDQVSVRVVVVAEGQDPTPHLLEAGIVDPVVVPFAWADTQASAGVMGDGSTTSVSATLEFDEADQSASRQDTGTATPFQAEDSPGT
jgi:hypothetical protein